MAMVTRVTKSCRHLANVADAICYLICCCELVATAIIISAFSRVSTQSAILTYQLRPHVHSSNASTVLCLNEWTHSHTFWLSDRPRPRGIILFFSLTAVTKLRREPPPRGR